VDEDRLVEIHAEAVRSCREAAVEFGFTVRSKAQAEANTRNLGLALRDVYATAGEDKCLQAAESFVAIWREKVKAHRDGEAINPEHTTWRQWRDIWRVWPKGRKGAA
jgi:hypothetical protein